MKDYFEPLIELGLTEDGLAVKVLDWSKTIDYIEPAYIAAFTLALYDTVLNKIDDIDQIQYQKEFLKTINHMIKKKENYDQFLYHKDGEHGEWKE